MLRSNLWVSAGLTNGTLCTVFGLLFSPDTDGPYTLPAAVCVEYCGFQGPAWNPQQPKVASAVNHHQVNGSLATAQPDTGTPTPGICCHYP